MSIIDVGANVGQSLEAFMSWWPDAHCLCLEPIPDAFEKLQILILSNHYKAWAENCAVGSKSANLLLNISRTSSTASSLKEFNYAADTASAHRGLRGSPSFLEIGEKDKYSIEVPVKTLDDILSQNSKSLIISKQSTIDLLKIDCQGYELEVLRGATKTLMTTKVILFEWTFDDCYGRPEPFYKLDRLLANAGFRLWDISHIYKDLTNMRTLWADFIYIKDQW